MLRCLRLPGTALRVTLRVGGLPPVGYRASPDGFLTSSAGDAYLRIKLLEVFHESRVNLGRDIQQTVILGGNKKQALFALAQDIIR